MTDCVIQTEHLLLRVPEAEKTEVRELVWVGSDEPLPSRRVPFLLTPLPRLSCPKGTNPMCGGPSLMPCSPPNIITLGIHIVKCTSEVGSINILSVVVDFYEN